jgi:glycosyltransferase involved in cell wall biosynthesis
MNRISVIITTRNPRLSCLRRVVEALQAQTLPAKDWDLFVVDNASDLPFIHELNLEWHPHAKYVREVNIGLVRARLCGIANTTAELLVFVEDDSVLNAHYLARALEIDHRYPMLGVWGGQLVPEYEVAPSEAVRPYLQLLGIRQFTKDIWGNNPNWGQIPIGAGICVRRAVALRYYQDVLNDPLRQSLSHVGDRVSCHGDTDLAVTSFDVGLGIGLFQSLELKHLIPKRKLNEKYLLQVLENSAAALVVFQTARNLQIETPPRGARWCLEQLKYWASDPVQRKISATRRRGLEIGRTIAADLAKKRQENINQSNQKPDMWTNASVLETIQHAAQLNP